MIHLYVWMRPHTGVPLRVGEILVSDPSPHCGERTRGEFRYSSDYLSHPSAYALDPINLPLSRSPIRIDNLETAHVTDLSDLAEAAERYENDPNAPMDELMRLFKAGSSPGGARPKVLVHEDGVHWLAKFPSIKDTFDIVRLEAASLATAQEAGIDVPEFSVIDLGSRSALLVKRFDVTSSGGRNHVISMKTLLGAVNFYYFGYSNMADIVRRVSDAPGKDLKGLFRQCVFNALIGNTDDHLKNFAMMRSQQGWHLTQAYDLLPDVGNNREHVLHFGAAGTIPTWDSLSQLGRSFGLSTIVAQRLIDEVHTAVRGFDSHCDTYQVPTQDIETLKTRMHLLGRQISFAPAPI